MVASVLYCSRVSVQAVNERQLITFKSEMNEHTS